MPWYSYRAARPDGSILTGSVVADNHQQALDSLISGGVHPLRIQPGNGPGRKARIRRGDVETLFRSVASLVEVGVPLEPALSASEPVVGGDLREIVQDLRGQLRSGSRLSDAMGTHPSIFPQETIGLIRAGERSSRLAEALQETARQVEDQTELREEVRSALVYPAVTLGVGVLSVGVIGTVVIPRFAEILTQLDAALPASIQVVVAISTTLRRWWWAFILGAIVAWKGASHYVSTRQGRRRVDAALLRLPVVGPIRSNIATARMAGALGGMLATGMPLADALSASEDATGDTEVAERLRQVRGRVTRGESLSAAIREEAALPEDTTQLIAIGESSGRLPDLLLKAAEMKRAAVRRAIGAAVKLVEPLLVVGLGIAVAGVAMVLLKAIYSVRPGF